jgi:hypothetical protein
MQGQNKGESQEDYFQRLKRLDEILAEGWHLLLD